jgi:hypothetical protein
MMLWFTTQAKIAYFSSVLKREAVCSSGTFVPTYKSTWHYNPEDQHQHFYDHENLKPQSIQPFQGVAVQTSYSADRSEMGLELGVYRARIALFRTNRSKV